MGQDIWNLSRRSVFACLALVLLVFAGPLRAQQAAGSPATANVGLYVSPPFVIKEGDRYGGMAIDLWETVAQSQGVAYRYREYPTFRDLVTATASCRRLQS